MNFKHSILTLLLLISSLGFGQMYDPVDFTFSVKRASDTEAELLMKATVEEGWHVYSLKISEESMVLPTVITFEKSNNYSLLGEVIEPEPINEFDKNAGEKLRFHEEEVTFKQKIKILSENDFNVKGELSFMVCNDRMCLPPEYIDLDFAIKGIPAKVEKSSSVGVQGSDQMETDPDYNPADEEPIVSATGSAEKLEIDYTEQAVDTVKTEAESDKNTEASMDDEPEEEKSLWGIFFLCLGAGIVALLTPCVFPMMPMTVSFFTKQSKTKAAGIRNATTYSLFIVFIYVLLSLPFHVFDSISPSILNEVSTNVPLNLFFFIVFIVFAISFFGAFEITLPNKWVNKADSASDKGGLIGIFFMALTLVLVSFSCTGPLLGGLLGSVLSTDGGPLALTAGMAGFGVGLALPFGLFAAFPSWLNSIPKSGGWLNNVKVVLGFLELALAFKFLSNADLVLQAGLLQREVFLAIWIAVFLALTVYLFNGFRMPHDSPTDKVSVTRLLFGLVSLVFTVYLIPGLWGAPLKAISGFPPPSFYSEAPGGFGGGGATVISAGDGDIPEGADPEHCPLGINCFHDFETGLAYAKEVNKPVMIDFTGWACVNCRKMEEQVWSDPRILEILNEEVVLISLYVDERKKLPEEEHYVNENGKKIDQVGEKWSDFQIKNFNYNAQPLYVILNHNSLEPLNGFAAYDPDIEKYEAWLEEGIKAFKEAQ